MKSIIAMLLGLTNYAQSGGGHWDYEDMDHWSHDYEMCGTLDQSPINIQSDHAVYDKSVCHANLNWTVDFSRHHFKISNNGHSIVLQPVSRIDWDPDAEMETTIQDEAGKQYTTLSSNENSIGRLPNYFLPEGSPHSEFCLHSFHFHWGLEDDEGSEHLLDDYQWPLEVHFVHYSCHHSTLGGTLGQFATYKNVTDAEARGDDTHQLAVVGVMFDIREYDNPAFDSMLNYDVLEQVQYPGSSEYPTIIDDLYLQDLIPDGVFTDGYYAYEGSLTTPPCTNIVRWHVMNARSYIGKSQMARFRALMSTANLTSAPNYRDPQYNMHTVYACMDEEEEVVVVNKTERAVIWVYTVFLIIGMCIFAAICVYRNKRKEQNTIQAAEPEKARRNRVQSRSSFGNASDHDGAHGHHGHATHH